MAFRLQEERLIYAVDTNVLLNIVHCLVYSNITLYYMTVKCSSYRPGVAQKVGRSIALLFHDRGTRGG